MESRIESYNINYFLTLPGEELLVFKRQHWIVLLPKILLISVIGLLFLSSGYILFVLLNYQIILLIVYSLLVWTLVMNFIVKIFVDWWYHFYIVTTRKIMEILWSPFYWDNIDDVFLDQVRTTEVDIKSGNIIQEFLDIGDVIISFDRPSHDKQFVLSNIRNPHEVGRFLGTELEAKMQLSPVWFKSNKANDLLHSEDVQPTVGGRT